MGSSLREAADFIDKAIRGGGVALVHCAAGASRSATAVLAYQVRVRGRAKLRASIRGQGRGRGRGRGRVKSRNKAR
jgi:protein-tyrosine phosphatase